MRPWMNAFLLVVTGGVLTMVPGCSVSTMKEPVTAVPSVPSAERAEIYKNMTLAFATRECTDELCRIVIESTPPQPQSPFFEKYQTMLAAFRSECGDGIAEYATNRGENKEATTVQEVLEWARSNGRSGLMIVCTLASNEAFGILCSFGNVKVKLECFDVSQGTSIYSDEQTTSRVCPVLWIMNYHHLSGKLNSAGRKDLSELCRRMLCKMQQSLRDPVPSTSESAKLSARSSYLRGVHSAG